MNQTSKLGAEFLGTLVLVLFGCGSAVISGANGTTGVGILGIAFAFGLAVLVMVYAIGYISGCHINPAISIAMVVAGRMSFKEAMGYIVAQLLGGIAGAGILYLIATGKADYNIGVNGLGQNGFGALSPQKYSLMAGFIAEVVLTFTFLMVILGATATKNLNHGFAGIAIGLSLTMIHIVGIPVTGVSVNPARSLGPALMVGGESLQQVWLFFVAPIIGAILAAGTHRMIDRN